MNRDEARKYVENLKRASSVLEYVRCEELRAFEHAKHAQQIDDLLAAGLAHARPRTSSGLVDMQRVFARAFR